MRVAQLRVLRMSRGIRPIGCTSRLTFLLPEGFWHTQERLLLQKAKSRWRCASCSAKFTRAAYQFNS